MRDRAALRLVRPLEDRLGHTAILLGPRAGRPEREDLGAPAGLPIEGEVEATESRPELSPLEEELAAERAPLRRPIDRGEGDDGGGARPERIRDRVEEGPREEIDEDDHVERSERGRPGLEVDDHAPDRETFGGRDEPGDRDARDVERDDPEAPPREEERVASLSCREVEGSAAGETRKAFDDERVRIERTLATGVATVPSFRVGVGHASVAPPAPPLSPGSDRGRDGAVIVAVGTDLVEISRIERALSRHGERFERRVFTEGERAYCARRRPPAPHFAARFAAKEAVMKVLGTGWKKGVRFLDIEVARDPGGPPSLHLHRRSAEVASAKGIARLHLSLTHDAGIAVAFVVAEDGPR